jgi:8-oxo-dGTP pyrophosphatase MutT (NUDIX family)
VSARDVALTELRGWAAPTADQAALRDDYVAHLETHPDGLRRSCQPGHLTAGVLVLSPGLDAVLLNLHGKAQRWFHFGGHLEDGDASLLAAARREAAEESGIPDLVVDPTPVHLDLHHVEFCGPHGRADHLDVRYAALAPVGAEAAASAESLDVRWWPLEALPDLEPEMHTLIALSRERLQSSPGEQARRGAQPSASPSSRAPAE